MKGFKFSWYYFAVVLVFILGFFLRAQEVLSRNYLFLIDQGRDMLAVRDIVFNHHPTLIGPYTSLGGVFQGPLYYYLLAIPTALFNGDPWGPLFLMLVMSMAVMGIAFYFIKRLFGPIAALIVLILFAVSPEAIAAATYTWNPHPMWIILTSYIFALYFALKKNDKLFFLVWPLVTLSFHFETAFGVFLFASTFVYIAIFHRVFLRNKTFWLSILASFVLYLPQILFDVRHDFLMSRSVIKIFQGSDQGLSAGAESSGWLNTIPSNFKTVGENFRSSLINSGKYMLFPTLVTILAFIVGVRMRILKTIKKDELFFLQLIGRLALLIVVCCLLYPFPLRYWFLTGFQSFFIIGIGILLARLYQPKHGKILLLLLLGIIIMHSVERLNILYFNPPDDGGVAKIKGKLAAIDYIYKDAGKSEFGLLVFTPPVMTDAYDYLIWWYGEKKYGVLPHQEKKGTVYLLMEPDPYNPSSYNGWLETVIMDGEVIETRTLPSGLIVQKRVFEE